MVWDLRGALLKKQEVESARLADFEFRHRARSLRLLATELGMDAAQLVPRIAIESDAAILEWLVRDHGLDLDELSQLYRGCRSRARVQLIEEIGDPSPHRLA